MSTQEQRERFEAWATKANFDVERYGISPGYQDTHTDDAWVAWQAAEAAAIERCAVVLSACGGGGSDGTPSDPHYKAVYPVPLRPCETTGPTAPSCPASQAAGAH